MFWADRVAQDIIASGKYKPYWVDDMKTPSGRIHVGSLRGVVVHDLMYRALQDAGVEATFSYVFEDHDPMDDIPQFLDKSEWGKYLGVPLLAIPSPVEGFENYAQYFAKEFEQVFTTIGSHPKIIWTSDLYKSGRMNEGIKKCLDHADVIREIYNTTYEKKLPDTWYPFQPICSTCGKLSTTKTTAWDGQNISFECQSLKWVQGCGYAGKQSPLSGDGKYVGKLPWKIEWPVKWSVIGVTVEGAGKDHMSRGGSHDIASLIAQKVLQYPVPYPVGYEFFLVGGKKMSSSKGRGTSAKEVSDTLPPYLLRFLMVRTQIAHTIDFDPVGWTIPDLFDEYDRCWQAYIEGSDEDLSRMFILSQTTSVPAKTEVFLPRFRAVAQMIQNLTSDPNDFFEKEKGNKLTEVEKKLLEERVKYAKLWLANYAPDEVRVAVTTEIPPSAQNLAQEQKEYLRSIIAIRESCDTAEELQQLVFEKAKEHKLPPLKAFSALYQVFLGKNHGPKAGTFLASLSKEFVKERITSLFQ